MGTKGASQATQRREHLLAQEAKRVLNVDPFGGIVTDGNFTFQLERAGSGITYLGVAQIGTATSASTWQVRKLVENSGTISITWAEGTDEFTNKWDDRATYTYS